MPNVSLKVVDFVAINCDIERLSGGYKECWDYCKVGR